MSGLHHRLVLIWDSGTAHHHDFIRFFRQLEDLVQVPMNAERNAFDRAAQRFSSMAELVSRFSARFKDRTESLHQSLTTQQRRGSGDSVGGGELFPRLQLNGRSVVAGCAAEPEHRIGDLDEQRRAVGFGRKSSE